MTQTFVIKINKNIGIDPRFKNVQKMTFRKTFIALLQVEFKNDKDIIVTL